MYKPVKQKTVVEQLIDAYKAQVTTYVRLLEVKDAQVASLEERIKDLEMKLNHYKCDNTGLTAKEREEIAKLSKEIMSEELHDLSLPIIQWLRKNHNPHKAVIITVDHSKIVEDQIGIPFN